MICCIIVDTKKGNVGFLADVCVYACGSYCTFFSLPSLAGERCRLGACKKFRATEAQNKKPNRNFLELHAFLANFSRAEMVELESAHLMVHVSANSNAPGPSYGHFTFTRPSDVSIGAFGSIWALGNLLTAEVW